MLCSDTITVILKVGVVSLPRNGRIIIETIFAGNVSL